MNQPMLTLILLALAYFPIRSLLSLRSNIKAAKASGIPYIVTPTYIFDVKWIVLSNIVLPILYRILPKSWQGRWLDVMEPEWAWKRHYLVFGDGPRGVGHDTFLLVSPSKTTLLTADPSVINQVTSRRNDFPKPIGMYQGIDLYGKNVVTTEGPIWRRHRKSTVPPFGEKNNKLVWSESIFQAHEMLRHWQEIGEQQKSMVSEKPTQKGSSFSSIISELSHDTMRLSLYVISRAGFDVRCEWPGKSPNSKEGVFSATEIGKGHKMSYVTSLETLLLRMIALFALPAWLLEYAPLNFLRQASLAFSEWGQYMTDIYDKKKTEIEQSNGLEDEGMDLMGAMIRTSGQIPGTVNYGKPDMGLSKDEILGNSFVLFLAGHETAANTIHFCMLFLAMRPHVQRRLQADLDSILGERTSDQWSYETDLPALFAGMPGAVMNEELRIIPPIGVIPKSTPDHSPQQITIAGKSHIVPAGATVGLVSLAVQRNPKFWPHSLDPKYESGNDLDDFKPDRWFVTDNESDSDTSFSNLSADGLGIDASPDTAPTFFRPVRGAYIPFSEGARACLGRRFAQVEILATLAVIFQRFSVELSVDEYATESDVLAMDATARRSLYGRAVDEAERKIRDEMGTIITLQLRGKPVKVRICERGRELFGEKIGL